MCCLKEQEIQFHFFCGCPIYNHIRQTFSEYSMVIDSYLELFIKQPQANGQNYYYVIDALETSAFIICE